MKRQVTQKEIELSAREYIDKVSKANKPEGRIPPEIYQRVVQEVVEATRDLVIAAGGEVLD